MLAVEIGKYLGAQIAGHSIDLTGNTGTIFIDFLPDAPDEALRISATGGPEASTKDGYAEPSIQVMARGDADPRTSSDLADLVYAALHGLRYETLTDGTLVVRSTGIQSAPVSIGKDESGRHRHTVNFRLLIRLQTTHSLE